MSLDDQTCEVERLRERVDRHITALEIMWTTEMDMSEQLWSNPDGAWFRMRRSMWHLTELLRIMYGREPRQDWNTSNRTPDSSTPPEKG